jgi:hypothetical protein
LNLNLNLDREFHPAAAAGKPIIWDEEKIVQYITRLLLLLLVVVAVVLWSLSFDGGLVQRGTLPRLGLVCMLLLMLMLLHVVDVGRLFLFP